jgi:hypothetical protein
MDRDSAPPARRRARVALLVAGAVVLLAAAVGAGVILGHGGNGNGASAGAATAVGTAMTAGGSGGDVGAVGAAVGGSTGGQTGSGGGGTTRTTSRTTTSTATSTTTGSTTTTTRTTPEHLEFVAPPQVSAKVSCTPSKSGGYDFTVNFFVTLVFTFTSHGTFHYYWDNRRYPEYGVDITTDPNVTRDVVVGPDIISGNRPSRTDTVTGSLHILEPPSIATTVPMRSTICPG